MKRQPQFLVRTAKMSDEMYEHVMKRCNKKGFREYVFELIEKDMEDYSVLNGVENLISRLNEDMTSRLQAIEKEVKERSFVGQVQSVRQIPVETDDLKEGQVISADLEIKGNIDDSEFNFDF